MIDWTPWVATVDFTLDGLRGRHVSTVEAEHVSMAEFRGYMEFEWEAISLGLGTWECGCCLNDERLTFTAASAVQAGSCAARV